ncbi:MAG: hypothetical protein A3G32_08450 [Deltaproteobacteria bacterium RIFCSPLOWO2_12_FULL_40_28]|nr:MAG: hypothetical protein A3C45_01150 [Deltaproteobacteria bacterium RIFCSPHIGHO2_02_FULL_40_28]OGQ20935.1 MAG: hypothetical protein A3E27_03815 [Deltaproteobacteria bacterium RIFCSPHIGHO2_12_FULL_40_32]OGQ39336.1 MAG: hypothetical protein A3I69_05175 [Deltaproteobacteria bacterium RIFCSPLOWO2_02_FULL_40_36]OGQ54617.1 MAG: hypothetical protein A3G32_08450 [Deltaproteobacteria bacterium RIFCSPLOWO2_12_FULL_40_28]
MASKKPLQDNSSTSPGTVVITGTSSFKGSRLLRELENNPRIKNLVAIDKHKPQFSLKKARFYRLDLTETTADAQLTEILKKEKCSTLVHCALPITPPRDQAYSHELISVGTMYVLTACAAADVKKIILPTTTDVYGAFPTNPNFLQENLHKPKGDLLSKFLADCMDAENQALSFSKKYPDRIVTILRPCTILGPTVQSFKTRLLRRFFFTTMLGFDPLIQFIHEDDIMAAFHLAIFKDCPGIFNIVGDGVLPLSRVLAISGKFHIPLPQIGFKTLVQLLWYLDIAPAPSSHVNFLRYLCIADGSKAKKVMGFTPRFSTKDALLSFVGAERLREINLIELNA